MIKEKTKKKVNSNSITSEIKDLILHNDDIHSFDYVIDSLIKICKHSLEQAEQCTVIVHYKGKCAVKTGVVKQLTPVLNKLSKIGLTVTIE